MRNNYYKYSRRFREVYPTYQRFKENTDPYLNRFPESIEEEKELIYNRLKLKYASSFFRFTRIGTIYSCTVSFLNQIIPMYLRLKALEKIEREDLKKLSSYSESRTFLTDNTKEENVDGFESEVNTNSMTSFIDENNLIKEIMKLRQNIEKEYEKYNKWFLKDIQERGGYE